MILFVFLPCHSEFYLFLNATLRQVRFPTWHNPEQLVVAQVLIKNIKLWYCANKVIDIYNKAFLIFLNEYSEMDVSHLSFYL